MPEPIIDVQGWIDFVVRHAGQEWAIVTGAPITLLVIALLLALASWWIVSRLFEHKLAAKNLVIESKDATIETLTERQKPKMKSWPSF
jgi:hypothetical protein